MLESFHLVINLYKMSCSNVMGCGNLLLCRDTGVLKDVKEDSFWAKQKHKISLKMNTCFSREIFRRLAEKSPFVTPDVYLIYHKCMHIIYAFGGPPFLS